MKKRKSSGGRLNVSWFFVITLSWDLMMAVHSWADDRKEATQIVEKACMTLDNFMSNNTMGPFRGLLRKAQAVVIAPSLLKGAFIVGVSGGNAVGMTGDDKADPWSEPAFYHEFCCFLNRVLHRLSPGFSNSARWI